MLKIWKQAWKKGDSKRSQIGQGDESRSDTPHTDSDTAPSPESLPSVPAIDDSQSRNKRTHACVGPISLPEDERSPKKVKLGHSCDNAPRNLPGHSGLIPDGLSVPPSHPSIFDKTVLRQTGSQNSALFTDTRNTITHEPSKLSLFFRQTKVRGIFHEAISRMTFLAVVPVLSQYLSCAVQTVGSRPTDDLHVVLVATELANSCLASYLQPLSSSVAGTKLPLTNLFLN